MVDYPPLLDLGEAALSGTQSTDKVIREQAGNALSFLGGVTRFIRSGNSAVRDDVGALEPGRAAFVCDLSNDETTGLLAAKAKIPIAGGTHPLAKVTASYRVIGHSGPVLPGAVDINFQLAGHPDLDSGFVRLSGARSGAEFVLRLGMGYLTHHKSIEPMDTPAFTACRR